MNPLVERFGRAIEAGRDPVRAVRMAAYMRDQFPFAGIAAPELAVIYREAAAGLPPPVVEADVTAAALACWELPEREYQHLGGAHLRRHAGLLGPASVGALERLVTTKSWWDTVDELATHVAGTMVARHPALRTVMERWVTSENLWLARVAILHQERWKQRTDAGLLFDFCLRRAGDREFFLRKAIGWALRSYAKTDPDAVAAFLAEHGDRLSGLSRREAQRGVEMGRAAMGRRPLGVHRQ
jgi:3-methyladenine DNA glycosylase AlkD